MLSFSRGESYSRADVKERAGLSRKAKGGPWDTGVVEHAGEFLIFTNVGTEGRTGHSYGNRWEGANLRWYHKRGSHLGWPSVRRLLQPGCTVHIFWRSLNDMPFQYGGAATAREIVDSSPVEIVWSFDHRDSLSAAQLTQSPEELSLLGTYSEGAAHQVLVNAYERDRAARQACIDYHGCVCAVCGLRFEERYGELGEGFIHVHHVIPISQLGATYQINPLEDLVPVCPNCHAMLHRPRQRPLSVDELRDLLC